MLERLCLAKYDVGQSAASLFCAGDVERGGGEEEMLSILHAGRWASAARLISIRRHRSPFGVGVETGWCGERNNKAGRLLQTGGAGGGDKESWISLTEEDP